MSEEDDESGDKEHDASPQKLIEARKKGDIPRSADLLMAASNAGFLLALASLGGWAVTEAGSAGMVLLDQSDQLSSLMLSGATAPLSGILLAFAGPPLVLLLIPPVVVLALVLGPAAFWSRPTGSCRSCREYPWWQRRSTSSVLRAWSNSPRVP
jgi:flagellar biosynthesis protein FlhB